MSAARLGAAASSSARRARHPRGVPGRLRVGLHHVSDSDVKAAQELATGPQRQPGQGNSIDRGSSQCTLLHQQAAIWASSSAAPA
jgi:hypothetical protein